MSAEKKNFVRMVLPEPTPAAVAPIADRSTQKPRGLYGVGANIRSGAAHGLKQALGMIRMQGLSNPVTVLPAVLSTQPGRVAARDFMDGLQGNPKGGAKVAPVAEKAATKVVEKALAAGRAAAPKMTNQERMAEQLGKLLSSPNLTLRAQQAAAGMLAQTTPKPVSALDAVMGEAALRADMLHQQELKAAGNDPKLGVKALENDLARWLMLAGKGQQAMMLPPTLEGQE